MVTQKPAEKTNSRSTTSKAIAKPEPKAALKKPVAATKAAPAKIAKVPAIKAVTPALKKPVTPVATALKPATKSRVVKAEKKTEPKLKKIKQVRDSFTMPETEYEVLGQVKKACLKAGFEIKKSDLLRIGVSLIKNLETGKLKTLLAGLTPLKVGRPKK
jgi:hypothetical protein